MAPTPAELCRSSALFLCGFSLFCPPLPLPNLREARERRLGCKCGPQHRFSDFLFSPKQPTHKGPKQTRSTRLKPHPHMHKRLGVAIAHAPLSRLRASLLLPRPSASCAGLKAFTSASPATAELHNGSRLQPLRRAPADAARPWHHALPRTVDVQQRVRARRRRSFRLQGVGLWLHSVCKEASIAPSPPRQHAHHGRFDSRTRIGRRAR